MSARFAGLVVAHGPRDVDAVALTFDDGPGTVTPAILTILRDRGARATFNVLGARVRHGAPLVRRAVADGHELGVHGWRHRDLSRDPVRAWAEISRASATIRAVSGVVPRVFRPPLGATSHLLALAARAAGLVTVTWDVDPRDFSEPGAETIRERVAAGVRPGSIVLLHDDRPGLLATAVALDGILDDLAERGLATVTSSRLLAVERSRDEGVIPRSLRTSSAQAWKRPPA
ncbi:MAG TPA: polysaccharide deacetylase family protein [Acidimicrobiia bacterium]|nr:polysaccharide deacetylase family protein [Acidimicrobiia bacterium]